MKQILSKFYYSLRPVIPRRIQIYLRATLAAYKMKKYTHIWPIDPKSAGPTNLGKIWPEDKKFALVLSHDVDTQKGHDDVLELMNIEEQMGFKSTFNFVPERYNLSMDLIQKVKDRGFQVCVHGLKHDGKLFSSRKIFDKRAKRINQYIKKWNVIGFTSPSMHHNLEWMHTFNIKHATSTFDTDPFEPQSDSIRTIFPFWVSNSRNGRNGYVEIPLTLPQDHLLFIILKQKNIEIWKRKIDWIAEKSGMALMNTHTDYMCFDGRELGPEEYPVEYYIDFLKYIKTKYSDKYWHVLPSELAHFWTSGDKLDPFKAT